MFEKFGEFDSLEELNLAAEGFLKEGDTKSILELAVENGIDEDDVKDYIDGYTQEFASLSMATYGRLNIEQEEISKNKNVMEKAALELILTMLRGMCTDMEISAAVMKKGKRVEGVFKALRDGASRHKNGSVGMSCGTDRQLCEIIKYYYTQSESKLKEKIEELYK